MPVVRLDMTNGDIRKDLLALARVITTHVSRDVVPKVKALDSTMNSRLGYFVRINPPIFLGSKAGEDPQEFLDDVYKMLSGMEMTPTEKAELASYKLRDVAQVL